MNWGILKNNLKMKDVNFFKGDLREIDLLNVAMQDCDYVVHLAAMWLLHCKDYPRTAFDVNIKELLMFLKLVFKIT